MRCDMKLIFNIQPVPASRPRVTRWSTYYLKKYSAFRDEMKKLIAEQEIQKLEGLLEVNLYLSIAMPKSWSKKKKTEKVGAWQDGNADNDNYEKAIFDALNGVAYNDDCQIVLNSTERRWQENGSITIFIKELPCYTKS